MSQDGAGTKIFLNPKAVRPHLTLAQEIGHALDFCGMTASVNYLSALADDDLTQPNPRVIAMRAVLDAIMRSTAFKELMALGKRKKYTLETVAGKRYNVDVPRRYINEYLATPVEVFGQAYAQWITSQSEPEDVMRAQLAGARRRSQSRLYFPAYWEEEDFVAVAAAMQALFRDIGWIQ